MHINKTMLFLNPALGNSNKAESQKTKKYITGLANTNRCDSFTFKGLKPKFLPETLVESANKVLAEYRKLDEPLNKARWTLSSTKSTKAEQELAEAVLLRGIKYEAPVKINGNQQTAKAELGQYINGWALCIKVGEGKEAQNYRIMLDKSTNRITTGSEIRVQKLDETGFPSGFISLTSKDVYNQTIETLKKILNAFFEK